MVSHPTVFAGFRSLLLHLDESGLAGSNRRNRMGGGWHSAVADVRKKSDDACLIASTRRDEAAIFPLAPYSRLPLGIEPAEDPGLFTEMKSRMHDRSVRNQTVLVEATLEYHFAESFM